MSRFHALFSLPLIAGSIAFVASPAQAEAQIFKATCVDSTPCNVEATGEQIKTSRGLRINAEDIVYWSMSDNTSKRSLGWCFWVGVKCYDREDIRFMIKYMDGNGNRQITQIGFFNNKPAQAFASFLNAFSGLEAGVTNVHGSTRRASALDPDSVPPFSDVTVDPRSKSKGAQHVGMPGGITPAVNVGTTADKATKMSNASCHAILKGYGCSYQRYLAGNPTVKAWADANPELASQERVRLGSTD